MARWNHFSDRKYKPIDFFILAVGEKFRMDKFEGKRRRSNIIMVKTGHLSYKELKSGEETTLFGTNINASSYSELITPLNPDKR